MNDQIKAIGALDIVLTDIYGNVKEQIHVPNLVVTVGKNHIAARLGSSATAMSHMAIGSGAVAAAASDSALGTELGRVALTSTTVNTNVVTYVATFGAGVGTGAVTEAGLFNAASAGTLLCRTLFSVINKSASDTLTINWNVTIS
jgi:hypothetical protein